MASQKDLNQLAESIKLGLEKHGVHVLDEAELAPVLDRAEAGSGVEKRMHLENFASTYGFDVHWSTFLQVAIFRKLGQGGAGAVVDTEA